MTEKEFIGYFKQNVKIEFQDGEVLTGRVTSFTWAVDNVTDEAEIDLSIKNGRVITIQQSEVKNIEIID